MSIKIKMQKPVAQQVPVHLDKLPLLY